MEGYVYTVKRQLPPRFAEFVSLAHTVAISIDLHRGHLSEDPDCPCPAPRARDVVEGVNRFHVAARRLGVPVIHVRSTLRAGGVDDVNGVPSAWRITFPLHVGDIPNAGAHALAGSRWTEFVTEVAPGDLIVDGKKRLSAFYPTDLDFLLRNLGAKRVVLTGCMTDCCVLNTAFDASNLGYRVTVLADLVRGTDETLEAAALAMISLHIGVVADSGDLLAEWRRAGAGVRP
ncbi:nicotinamidase-related amidase [Roseiarcus fermentans]|uniref:Nicotinamidase-related amidase n=1 Tax=Roseiarcus fermentans TaxID=1473586 RepID=A0A366FGK1_9HYPH|nr:isochorismatase family cysteine hydrolase [Roseiarcus fermentans]RBP12849.1 nicotinamidase-related amidase [Roseiarcus fermentans]